MSLSRKNRRSMAGYICKIALKTVPRCGIAALILLCLGFYFLFPACQTFQQIQAEKNTPFELAATTDSGSIDLSMLMQIDGVEKISPILNLSASLSLNDYTLDCEIRAVYSSFLSLKFIQGTMYQDSSNMPYLILNKPAAMSFVQDYQTITVSPEDIVIMSVGGAERKAIVCGIFDDGSESPTVYMSYDVAQKEYGTGGQTELIFLLSNMGCAEDVVSTLQRQNIYASFDPNLTLAWELLQKQCWQTILLSIGLLACATILIREKRHSEKMSCKSEEVMLLLSGMTADAVKKIYPLRIILTEILCSVTAALISVTAGTFSGIAIGINLFYATIYGVAAAKQEHFDGK